MAANCAESMYAMFVAVAALSQSWKLLTVTGSKLSPVDPFRLRLLKKSRSPAVMVACLLPQKPGVRPLPVVSGGAGHTAEDVLREESVAVSVTFVSVGSTCVPWETGPRVSPRLMPTVPTQLSTALIVYAHPDPTVQLTAGGVSSINVKLVEQDAAFLN